jgi:hypothetical protein
MSLRAPRLTLGELVDLTDLLRVRVNDAWSGMGGHRLTAFDLHRGPEGALTGNARHFEDATFQREAAIALPPAATAELLGFLAAAPLVKRRYHAHIDHTDDAPHVEMVLDLGPEASPGGFVTLFSRSQGPYLAPWGAYLRETLYASPGEPIGRALTLLRKAFDPGFEPWGFDLGPAP